MSKRKEYIKIALIIICLIVIDQVIKICIPKESIPFLPGKIYINYAENTGGAFSILSGNILTVIAANALVLALVFRFLIFQFDKMDNFTKYTICLILSGGISNLIDRIIRGFVIDYIDISKIIDFPIFNLADMCIVCGWILLIFLTIKYSIKHRHIEGSDKNAQNNNNTRSSN